MRKRGEEVNKITKWLMYTNPATWIIMVGGALGGVLYSAGQGIQVMNETLNEDEEVKSTRRKEK